MLKNTFRQLREQSDLLVPRTEAANEPLIYRSLNQIRRELNSMSKRIKPDPELDAKAHYFLASGGINTEHIITSIDTSRAFQVVEEEDHTDVKKYLQEEHEKVLIHIIEEQRRSNDQDFDDYFEAQHEGYIKAMLEEANQDAENRKDYEVFEKYNNGNGVSRIIDYAHIVSQLNHNRSLDMDFDVIEAFANLRNMSELQKAQDSAYEAWDMLRYLVNHAGLDNRPEGRFMSYITAPAHSALQIQTRRQLIQASKSWLERQVSQLINDALNKNATKIQIGGNPSITHRLRAFINFKFKTSTGWVDDRLEIVDGLPIWTFVYLLIRMGHLTVAAKFVDDHREMFTSERRFVSYFEEYANADSHNVSTTTAEAILSDYNRFEYGEIVTDPYKILIYKLMGRCELHKKTLPDVIHTTEDFIWLQLMLVREVIEQESDYRLADAQDYISSFGPTYFDQEEFDPWNYFKILLATLQFEKAVNYLYQQKHLRLETVHFGLALVYYGLLENKSHHGYPSKFAEWIHFYVQAWIPKDQPQLALQYLYLLTLYTTKQGYPNDDMIQLAISFIIQFTLEKNDFKTLIGTPQTGRGMGLLYQQKELLNIFTDKEYIQMILFPMAQKCIDYGRTTDAVYIYGLSGDYQRMVNVLAKHLSSSLQTPESIGKQDPILSHASHEETIQFALDTMEHYEKNEQFNVAIDSHQRLTIRRLIELLYFRRAYSQGQLVQALQALEHLNIIPLSSDYHRIQQAVTQFNTTLDQTIKENIPELLLNAMDVVYKVWLIHTQDTPPPYEEIKLTEQMARGILIFTGLIQVFIPNDIIIRLNKTEMLMQQKRR
ncbi:Nup93/Nic96-domain-containing protein [Gilbertella persicaria]|nr:Nup93/Nic96-domain-containing protein [Gilbertella persicaria]KAI8088019.1 Nup93/Nic96-domain-containing protein [Gilbertella persicaria]